MLTKINVALTPTETVLLANYPNPFNPETWIPYQLSTAADVKFTIYDTNAIEVRQLDLGYQLAGYYTDKTKAAYWDGRNGAVVAGGCGCVGLPVCTYRFGDGRLHMDCAAEGRIHRRRINVQ